jgi:hypothetical protein
VQTLVELIPVAAGVLFAWVTVEIVREVRKVHRP